MAVYRIGYGAERDLRIKLQAEGWRVIRSGGSKKPDLIAGRKGELMVIECKVTNRDAVYVDSAEIVNLLDVAAAFKAKPVLAVKRKNRGWQFVDARALEKTENNYVARFE